MFVYSLQAEQIISDKQGALQDMWTDLRDAVCVYKSIQNREGSTQQATTCIIMQLLKCTQRDWTRCYGQTN